MKKVLGYKNWIGLIFLFHSMTALAQSNPAPTPAAAPQVSAAGAGQANIFTASTVSERMPDDPVNGCRTAEREITNYCSQNPDLALANQKMNVAKMSQSETAIGETVQNGSTIAKMTVSSLAEIKAACTAAANRCLQLCRREVMDHRNKSGQYRASTPPQMQLAQQEDNEANTKSSISNTCQREQKTLDAQASSMQMSLAEIIAALAALMQQLGIGEGGGDSLAGIDEEEQDKCEGEYAHLLIECKGQDNPSGSRAGLSGAASLNGKTSGGLGSLFDGSESGEPGGEAKDRDSSGGGNPFNASGMGSGMGSGFGSNGSGSGSGSGSSKEGLDTDINKGYMGTGGYGGGGGGGGGGYKGGGGRGYSSLSPLDGAGASKAALQKKLNKYANQQSRKPASSGGANGPMTDNWTVVNKAYKNNSRTMFHKQ